MTAKRRFLSGLLGGRTDRPAVASVTSVATVAQMELTEAYFPDVHRDGAAMARLAAGAHDILGYDAIMPYFSVQAEASALGCEVDWGDRENMPVERSHPYRDPEDAHLPLDFLAKPAVKAVLDALRILRKTHGSHVALVGKAMGPWTLAYHMHGIQDFLMETISDPDRVRGFLRALAEVTVHFARAQIEAGADAVCIADHATGDLVSAATYREFLLPVHRELNQRIGCPTVLHICGDTLDRMGHISESGFDCFHFDSKVDARAGVAAVAERISLMGNVNNPEVLLHGTPQEAARKTTYAIEAGVDVVGPECAIPLRTPLENLQAISQAAQGSAPTPL